jgi:hypothetical protein
MCFQCPLATALIFIDRHFFFPTSILSYLFSSPPSHSYSENILQFIDKRVLQRKYSRSCPPIHKSAFAGYHWKSCRDFFLSISLDYCLLKETLFRIFWELRWRMDSYTYQYPIDSFLDNSKTLFS